MQNDGVILSRGLLEVERMWHNISEEYWRLRGGR